MGGNTKWSSLQEVRLGAWFLGFWGVHSISQWMQIEESMSRLNFTSGTRSSLHGKGVTMECGPFYCTHQPILQDRLRQEGAWVCMRGRDVMHLHRWLLGMRMSCINLLRSAKATSAKMEIIKYRNLLSSRKVRPLSSKWLDMRQTWVDVQKNGARLEEEQRPVGPEPKG